MLRFKLVVSCFLLVGHLGCDAQDQSTPVADESVPGDSAVETNPPETSPNLGSGMLRHAVFFSFKESSSEEDIQGVQ